MEQPSSPFRDLSWLDNKKQDLEKVKRLEKQVVQLQNQLCEVTTRFEQEQLRFRDQLQVVQDQNKLDNRQMLLEILETVDAFSSLLDKVGANAGDDPRLSGWTGNFRTIFKMLNRSLLRIGVSPIEIIPGQLADPTLHHIVEVSVDESLPDETILEVIQSGYIWQGQLLRAAKVRTVKNKQS